MKSILNRREALKSLGILASSISLGASMTDNMLAMDDWSPAYTPDKAITAITLGAGNRGNVYGDYAVKYPEQLQIIGVAEPIQFRVDKFAEKHNIAEVNRFKTWEDVFDRPKFADAIIITTPDDLHYGPCMAALEKGYDILLEKPIAPTEEECRNILAKAQSTGNVVAVCHVLRYAPYFIDLRKLIESGAIGELVSVQHFEPIHHIHMAHSFVRGNWHNSTETTPIILAKSCHDLDIMRWLVGQPCEKVAAFGGLKWFRKENIPEGATSRCMDGCAVEKDCPYSAVDIYHRKQIYTYVFDLPEDKEKQKDAIWSYLKTTDYGRCVYQMDNDQADHYVASFQFKNGITAAFNMEAFTSYHGRRTRIMGSMGDIVGDMSTFTHTDFRTGKVTKWEQSTDGHGGGDWRLVNDWIQAVHKKDPTLLSSTIEASIESHLMGFAAEKSRSEGIVANV